MNEATRTRIVDFVVETFLFGAAGDLPDDGESLVRSGVVDSTGVLELIEFLESEFGIEVTEAETVPANLDTIERLVGYVVRKSPVRLAG